jgi:hypothetical protein
MKFLPKIGRLEGRLRHVRFNNIPKSETVQTIEITKRPDGLVIEDEAYIKAEKEKKLAALKERYGQIEESQITWVMVKKGPT